MLGLYENITLQDDENLLSWHRQHGVVFFKRVILFLVVLAILFLFMYPIMRLGTYAAVIFLTAVVVLAGVIYRRFVTWQGSIYVITDRRILVITRYGFFKKKVVEIALNKTSSLAYDRHGLSQTLFRLGDISVGLKDSAGAQLLLINLREPQRVMDTISRAQADLTRANHAPQVEPRFIADEVSIEEKKAEQQAEARAAFLQRDDSGVDISVIRE